MAIALKEAASKLKTLAEQEKAFWDKQGDEAVTAEQKAELDTRWKEMGDLSAQVDEQSGYAERQAQTKDMLDRLNAPNGRPNFGASQTRGEAKSIAQQFVESKDVQEIIQRYAPNGAQVSEGQKIEQANAWQAKALVFSGTTSGGAMVHRDYAETELLPLRPLTIRQIVTVLRTGSNQVEYVRETVKTRAAAITPEATATSGSGYTAAAKPEAGLAYEIEQAGVKTIPVWMPMSRQILADLPQMESMINAFLMEDVELTLEEEVINGAGGSSHFVGLDNTPGLTPQPFVADALDSTGGLLTTTRKARTITRTIARSNPTGFLLNPYDWETIDLARGAQGQFYFGGPIGMGQKMLWGLPVFESEVIRQGTGYTGDLKKIVIWDRENATLRMTDSHSDFFTHNLLALLCELRAAMAVKRPAAIIDIDLKQGPNS